MKIVFLACLLLTGAPVCLRAQSPTPAASPASQPSPISSTGATLPPGIIQAQRAKPQPTPYQYPDAHRRFSRYVNATVGPVAIAEGIGLAGIMTWGKSPSEWGTHWEGFGRRVTSNFGWSAIKNTTIYGLDEALHLDSYQYRSTKKGLGSRISNAFASTFTARTKSGRRTIGVPRLIGTFLAPVVVAETWYPQRYNWKDGLRAGSYDLVWNIGHRLARELFRKK